jgi:hypothetical protein
MMAMRSRKQKTKKSGITVNAIKRAAVQYFQAVRKKMAGVNPRVLRVAGIILVIFTIALLWRSFGNGAADSEVLATVNGDKITAAELDITLQRMLGNRAAEMVSAEAEQKALTSLVMMRALAQQQEDAADDEELALIDIKTRHYRDELLVESYLRAHAVPDMPTENDIRAYYEQHPEQFGAAPVRTYEILQSNAVPNGGQLSKILQAMADAKQQRDWRAYAARLKAQALPLIYIQGRTDGPPLPAGLSQVVTSLSVNQLSDVFYLEQKPHLLRVVAITTPPARPLAEVRLQIRKALAVQHMKKAIAAAAEEVLKDSDVEYKNTETANERQ